MVKLPPKRRLFVREYLKDFNATQAAIRAGYSPRTADVQGAQLLGNLKVREALAAAGKGLERRLADIDLSNERILREIALRAYANMEDYTRVVDGKRVGELTQLTRDQLAAVQEITEDVTGGTGDGQRKLVLRQRFKLADSLRALEMLARHKALFNDKLNIEGDVLNAIADRIGQGLKRARKN